MTSGLPSVALLEQADLLALTQQIGLLDPALGAHVASFGELTAVVVPGISSPFVNRIYGMGAGRVDRFDDLDRGLAHYETRGIDGVGVMVSEGARFSELLMDGLASRGFVFAGRATKLWRRIDGSALLDQSDQVVVEASIDTGAVSEVLVAGYGREVAPAWWYAAPVGARNWQHFVALLAGVPVGAAALCVQGKVCWFGYAATVHQARRQGVQRALIRHRLRFAEAAGCRIAVTETGAAEGDVLEPSHRNLAALGFRLAYHRSTLTKSSGTDGKLTSARPSPWPNG